MKIVPVSDPSFKEYGRVLEGYNTNDMMAALAKTPLPNQGTVYVGSDQGLEQVKLEEELYKNFSGFLPIQVGYCNGHNTKLNCLEYHRSSEINMGTEDFILLLAKRSEIEDGKLDTSKVKAFLVKKGVLVEVFATSLHYAPCEAKPNQGFQVLVVLPKRTNEPLPPNKVTVVDPENKMLWAKNKWLLAHQESSEAKSGAYVGLVGSNIDIANDIKGE
jgi:ureidoglycolate hydrolase